MPSIKDTPELRQAFIEQYAINLGQFMKTCRELELDTTTVRRWRKQYSSFDDALSEVEEALNENVEGSLIKLALNEEKPNVVAKIFWLKNRAKDRWGDRPQPGQGEAILWFDQNTSSTAQQKSWINPEKMKEMEDKQLSSGTT